MCLYPLRIRNPGYESLVDCQQRSPFSELGVIPPDYMVDVPCGRCWQCLRQKRFELVSRLKVEQSVIPPGTRSYFITLTFDNVNLSRFRADYLRPVRLWLDRLRKRYGKFRYFVLSELGEKNTRRLHFHGILFGLPNIPYADLCASWKCGISWFGEVTERTCGYITKYIIKQQVSPDYVYKPYKIYSKSLGLGRAGSGLDFVRSRTFRMPGVGLDRLENAFRISKESSYTYALSRYYRKKLYTEGELLDDRYLSYQNFRYRFKGVEFETREDWLSYINSWRSSHLPIDYRSKMQKKESLVPSVRISSLSEFNYRLSLLKSGFEI